MTPIPRSHLIATLAGDDVCVTCRGQGTIRVTGPRDKRTCPMCRGRGVTPYRSVANQYARLDAKSRRRTAAEVER